MTSDCSAETDKVTGIHTRMWGIHMITSPYRSLKNSCKEKKKACENQTLNEKYQILFTKKFLAHLHTGTLSFSLSQRKWGSVVDNRMGCQQVYLYL